jgi:HSP20 family protein
MELTPESTERRVAQAEPVRESPEFVPAGDIWENSESYRVWLDMPGIDPRDVEVRFDRGTLRVWGKPAPRREEKARLLLSESASGDYTRTFNLTDTIDVGRITAEYEDGVLCLTLPKVEAARPKRIQVRPR